MDESILKADLFFFVTTIAVVIMTILGGIFMTYAVLILRDVRALVRRAREEATEFIDDIGEMRKGVKESVEDAGSVVRAAARAMKPVGIRQAVGYVINTILEATGNAAPKRRRSRKASPRANQEDYEDNE